MNFHLLKKVARTGVYGVVIENKKILLVEQKKGPYKGKLDFPGGGIEFGETPEQALRREFIEEVAFEFDSFKSIDNISVLTHVAATSEMESHQFFQIGMLYEISGVRKLENIKTEFEPIWVPLQSLIKDSCSSLLWRFISNNSTIKQVYLDDIF